MLELPLGQGFEHKRSGSNPAVHGEVWMAMDCNQPVFSILLFSEGEGFISAYKPLQSKEIRNRIGKIPPKIPPSRIHWGYMAVAARRNRTLGRAVSYTACSRKGPFPNGRAMLSLK
jgi:hypothetical protein